MKISNLPSATSLTAADVTPVVQGGVTKQVPLSLLTATAVTPTLRGINKEIYVSLRTDTVAGTGTAENPFDGSTAAKLDALLLAQTTNTAIRFGKGTFLTNLGVRTWQLQSGWVVTGAGEGLTTIQATGDVSAIHGAMAVLDNPAVANNIRISDLTVDCNSQNLIMPSGAGGEKDLAVGAIRIRGNNNLVTEVAYINAYGSTANNREMFGIFLVGGDDNTIRYCTAKEPHGTYGNPFAVSLGARFRVYENKAFGTADDLSADSAFNIGGVNTSYLTDSDIYDNHFVDCGSYLHHDTGHLIDVRIHDNTTVRSWRGLDIIGTAQVNPAPVSAGDVHGVIAYNNKCGLQNRASLGGVVAIGITGAASNSGHFIFGNTTTYDNSAGGLDQFNSAYCGDLTDTIFIDNFFDPESESSFGTKTNVTFSRNRTMTGGSVLGMEDTVTQNTKDTNVIGSERLAGTITGGGSFLFEHVGSYTIQTGDRFQMEVYLDEANPGFMPNTAFYHAGFVMTDVTDQNGVELNHGDITPYAKGRWYFRDVDLGSHVGQITDRLTFGVLIGTAGDYLFYLRNVKIISPTGAIRKAYYTEESRIVGAVDSGASSGASNLVIKGDFGGTIGGITSSFARRVAAPANAGSTGSTGDWAQDTGYIYICTASNTWKRVAIATWP